MKGLRIVSTGRCLPDRIVTNEDLTHIIDTSDAWITSRTGIRERRYLAEGQSNTDLAVEAARQALAHAGIDPTLLGACVVATVTPQHFSPTTACSIQLALGLPEEMPCFDMNVGCSGFVYGLSVIRGLLAQSDKPYALLVGSDALSTITDYTDRSTCILFADGAGAVVVTLDEAYPFHSILCAKGDPDTILIDGPAHPKPVIHMEGQATFRFATEKVPDCVRQLVDKAGITLDEVDWFIPHQANGRIVEFAARRLGTDLSRWFINIDHYGNTSAASIPIALDEMHQQGLLTRGQTLLCVGFGAGLTWGGALLRW